MDFVKLADKHHLKRLWRCKYYEDETCPCSSSNDDNCKEQELHGYDLVTIDQLRAIIKEASAPLVEAVKETIEPLRYSSREFGSICQFNSQRYINKQIKSNLNALAEFNKEFGND